MKRCEIIVEKYGKIEHVKLKLSELMLFVGDNNSGKSYLLSLLWALQNLGVNVLIPDSFLVENEKAKQLREIIITKMNNCIKKGKETISLKEYYVCLENIINESLELQKDIICTKIFNSETVSVGNLQIIIDKTNDIEYEFEFNSGSGAIMLSANFPHQYGYFIDFDKLNFSVDKDSAYGLLNDRLLECSLFFIKAIYASLLEIEFHGINSTTDSIYLPAARTGFMLTKNVINQVGRSIAFNSEVNTEQIIPFIRPINSFLDVINSLSVESVGYDKYKDIIAYIETEMTYGTIEISDLPSKEIFYMPQGKEQNIPLRVVSAVVSELSPLILILKHFGKVKTFYYEEPEMCLHPQLQNRIANIICKLVNCGTDIIVTTHSDIIIQYINNMIALSNRVDKEQIYQKLGYSENDILDSNKVSVYQLESKDDNVTKVEKVPCGKNGFVVDSFNDALDKIMNEAYTIQE